MRRARRKVPPLLPCRVRVDDISLESEAVLSPDIKVV